MAEAQADLPARYDEARKLGQTITTLVSERASEGLTPFVDLNTLPERYRAVVSAKPDAMPLTEDDVRQARAASLGLAIEATAQIAERSVPSGAINERLDSIAALNQTVRAGKTARDETVRSNSGEILSLAREAVARRLGKTPDQVVMRDQDLLAWLDEQYQHAAKRLGKSIDALKAYLDTSQR